MNPKSRAAMIRKIERRIRSKYVKRCWLCFIIALVIGLAGGIYLCQWGPLKDVLTDISQPVVGTTPAPIVEVTATPAAEPTVEVTPVPTVEVTPVPTATATPVVTPVATPVATPVSTPVVTPVVTPVATLAIATPAVTEDAGVAALSADETDEPDETDVEATAAPTALTVEATPVAPMLTDEEGNALGTIENPIPMGEVYTFDTEIVQGGTPRYDGSLSEFDTVSMTIALTDYLTPDYFVDKYSTQYKLTGSEAGAALAMNLLDNSGNQVINPQDMIEICFESEAGDIARGFQLMNAEIAGDYGVPLVSGAEQTYYKRFSYTEDPEMAFLTLTHYVDGQAVKVYFSLEPAPEAEAEDAEATEETEDPTEAITYSTLETGARGDDVQKLQARLIELGYLEGEADGIFGGMTAAAISAAQENGGMEATGVADDAFQQYIYSDSAVKAD